MCGRGRWSHDGPLLLAPHASVEMPPLGGKYRRAVAVEPACSQRRSAELASLSGSSRLTLSTLLCMPWWVHMTLRVHDVVRTHNANVANEFVGSYGVIFTYGFITWADVVIVLFWGYCTRYNCLDFPLPGDQSKGVWSNLFTLDFNVAATEDNLGCRLVGRPRRPSAPPPGGGGCPGPAGAWPCLGMMASSALGRALGDLF